MEFESFHTLKRILRKMDAQSRRYACYLVFVMVVVIWYALSPSRETRIRVSDPSFRQIENEGESRQKYKLALALEEGKTYRVKESTRHTATTRSARPMAKNMYEVLAETEYTTTVELDLQVKSVHSDGRIVCQAKMIDFVGYEETSNKGKAIESHGDDDDDGEESESERQNRNKIMFAKVREETRGVQFQVVLNSQGVVEEMDTYKLRERIVNALHEVGQLPMHLEYAVLVGGYDVFPANGAAFGPQGRTNVRAPVYRLRGTACDENAASLKNVKGMIVVADRGDCTFNKKAQNVHKHDAAALIVVDLENEEGPVMTYMSGEADVPIVTLIVNKDAGKTIEDEMRLKADFQELPNGDMTASDQYLVEILGGVEAVQALNEEDFEEDDESDPSETKRKRKSHSYNPVHADGLHDFVGIGYIVDEVIRTRFSIFPGHPVAIGSTWERTLMLSDGIDPTVRAEVNERYKLISISRAEDSETFAKVERGDFIAEISISARERPARVEEAEKEEALPINPDPDDESLDETPKITPQFARPSFKGHEFKTKGTLYVHLNTGFVLQGESVSEASSERTVVVLNKKSHKKKSMNAKVDIVARTEYSGVLL